MNMVAGGEEPAQALAALRARGAARLDPARFHAMEALARRLPGQAAPVRALLQHKLEAAVAAYAQRFAQAPEPAAAAMRGAPAGGAPLALLNAHIRQKAASRAAVVEPGEEPDAGELASVRRFRRAWARAHALERLDEALARKPANPGPLNSHALVLQTLALMRELSPAYLQRLLQQVDALQWLEQAGMEPARDAGRPAKAAGRKLQKK